MGNDTQVSYVEWYTTPYVVYIVSFIITEFVSSLTIVLSICFNVSTVRDMSVCQGKNHHKQIKALETVNSFHLYSHHIENKLFLSINQRDKEEVKLA